MVFFFLVQHPSPLTRAGMRDETLAERIIDLDRHGCSSISWCIINAQSAAHRAAKTYCRFVLAAQPRRDWIGLPRFLL
jgi:hypothetical protein